MAAKIAALCEEVHYRVQEKLFFFRIPLSLCTSVVDVLQLAIAIENWKFKRGTNAESARCIEDFDGGCCRRFRPAGDSDRGRGACPSHAATGKSRDRRSI